RGRLSRLWRRVASWCWLLKENGSTASGVSQWLEMWGSWIGYETTPIQMTYTEQFALECLVAEAIALRR
ncbi:hypothetical protein WX98_27190, partial [Pseudomonas syringae pv. persicae]